MAQWVQKFFITSKFILYNLCDLGSLKAEKYIEHYNKEHVLRGGCPSDWVYINGATGSLTPIFHQEMISYQLSPSFEAQPILWKSFKNHQRNVITFNGLCKAVMFVTFLYSKHFRKRKQVRRK